MCEYCDGGKPIHENLKHRVIGMIRFIRIKKRKWGPCLSISTATNYNGTKQNYFNVNYCPMCGRNLKEANRKADVDKLVESLKDGRNIKSPDTPKPRRATNRELSMWLAQGNGECLGSYDDADTAWNYPQKCSDTEVREGAKVRKWSDTDWHEPTVDYLFGGDDADR